MYNTVFKMMPWALLPCSRRVSPILLRLCGPLFCIACHLVRQRSPAFAEDHRYMFLRPTPAGSLHGASRDIQHPCSVFSDIRKTYKWPRMEPLLYVTICICICSCLRTGLGSCVLFPFRPFAPRPQSALRARWMCRWLSGNKKSN